MDEYQELGVEATEVRDENVGRDVAIGVGGILVVIAALIPLAAVAVTVGGVVIASVAAFAQQTG
ncbi:hypothetical protein ACDF64_06720 [Agromyces sp. MMS24-JH15]|uniref:hypothetical protein n=1 Tax=Agromyces sp. MMS24-JH15 TaxID=3243765 RepID=UPI003747F9D9